MLAVDHKISSFKPILIEMGRGEGTGGGEAKWPS